MSTRRVIWAVVHSSPWAKMAIYFSAFFIQIATFTILFHYFYPVLEGKDVSWPNALLFVMETVTTTGYGDLLPFQSQAMVLFTTIMMITGIVMIFMIVPLLLAPFLSSLIVSSPPRRTPRVLHNHVVIVGYGELARSLVESLMISDLEMVIVDDDETVAASVTREHRKGAYVIWGDYSDQETWKHAWVKNASNIIVCEEERLAAAIILGIREQTRARIIAVVDKLSFDRYLKYAGAEYVISPKHITGRILARHAVLGSHIDNISEGITQDTVVNAHGIRLVQIPIMPGSKAVGRSLRDLDLFPKYGFSIPFLSKGGHFLFRPGPELITDTTTRIFLIGGADRLDTMIEAEFVMDGDSRALAVIAGYGDVGSTVHDEMTAFGIECVVVDQKRYPLNEVVGNAEDEEVLREAQIESAGFCIVALNDDNVNIFTTLMARNMNPSVRILARANEPGSVDKLYRAGADYVALLPVIGGQLI
ncbi:MAG: NAD-binding protein, partial [Methanoregulaceae archaeon]|nr:NAD-binding protein [Methanoregulaceae archaeon]